MTDHEFATNLAKELGETELRIQLNLLVITRMVGQTECTRMKERAKAKLGELIKDGSRERTLGGLFFQELDNPTQAKARKVARKIRKELLGEDQ